MSEEPTFGFVDEFEALLPQVRRALEPTGRPRKRHRPSDETQKETERNVRIDVEIILRALLDPEDLERLLKSAPDTDKAELRDFESEQVLALGVVAQMLAPHAEPGDRLKALGAKVHIAFDRT